MLGAALLEEKAQEGLNPLLYELLLLLEAWQEIQQQEETTLHGDASRNLGATGRRGAAVPVEVGPARGQPDHPRRAGERDAFPGGELGGSFDMPISRHFAYKYNTAPVFSGLKPEFTTWTNDSRYYAKVVGFLSAFVSDPPQYIPVGELDTKNSVLVARGYNRESCLLYTSPSPRDKRQSRMPSSA